MPYEDPAYGDRPSYRSFGGRENDPDRYDEIQRARQAEREKDIAHQQDEIMTDVYQNFDTTGLNDEAESAGPVEGMHG